MKRRLILASASPRRQELLRQIGVSFTVDAADLDETHRPGEPITTYVARLSAAKAREVLARQQADAIVLGADTAVALGEELLSKPLNLKHARRMIERLSNATHWVHTGVTVMTPSQSQTQIVSTEVRFCALSTSTIDAYMQAGEWQGKAGGYAIQGLAGRFVTHINGSYSAVVGLPLYETSVMLAQMDADATKLPQPSESSGAAAVGDMDGR
jgi:septum formation protein